jgi:hypothetical protein
LPKPGTEALKIGIVSPEFTAGGFIRSRPHPKQTWKLPVKDWIRELHSECFGCIYFFALSCT